jgi:hypothetical protein
MNYLQLCKKVCYEAGIAGGANAITTVANNVGELHRVTQYVRDALIEIENKYQHSGLMLRYQLRSFQLTTVAEQAAYAWDDAAVVDEETNQPFDRFQVWLVKDYNDPPRCYLQSATVATQGYLVYMQWLDFKRRYRIGLQPSSTPQDITIDNQNRLVLGPTPNAVFIVNADLILGPQDLNLGDDPNLNTPLMPSQFHEVIVWRALMEYGMHENAPEVVTRAENKYTTWLADLEANQLCDLPMAGPMAGALA